MSQEKPGQELSPLEEYAVKEMGEQKIIRQMQIEALQFNLKEDGYLSEAEEITLKKLLEIEGGVAPSLHILSQKSELTEQEVRGLHIMAEYDLLTQAERKLFSTYLD